MSPKLIKPTLGRASESCWEEHTPKLEVNIAGSHHYVECTDVAHMISGTTTRKYPYHDRKIQHILKRVILTKSK